MSFFHTEITTLCLTKFTITLASHCAVHYDRLVIVLTFEVDIFYKK